MKVRITYRNEVFIEGKDMKEIAEAFDNMNVVPEGSDFVEVCSVEDAETYEDLMNEFDEVY